MSSSLSKEELQELARLARAADLNLDKVAVMCVDTPDKARELLRTLRVLVPEMMAPKLEREAKRQARADRGAPAARWTATPSQRAAIKKAQEACPWKYETEKDPQKKRSEEPQAVFNKAIFEAEAGKRTGEERPTPFSKIMYCVSCGDAFYDDPAVTPRRAHPRTIRCPYCGTSHYEEPPDYDKADDIAPEDTGRIALTISWEEAAHLLSSQASRKQGKRRRVKVAPRVQEIRVRNDDNTADGEITWEVREHSTSTKKEEGAKN